MVAGRVRHLQPPLDILLIPTADDEIYPVSTDDPTLEDGRLDELAARHGVTVAEVRRMMGPQRIERHGRQNAGPRFADPRAQGVVDVPTPSILAQSEPVATEDSPAVDDAQLEALGASLGVTIGDVRRMIEVAGPRRDGAYRGQLDVNEIRRRYEAGECLATIGAAMFASYTALRHAMVRTGIPTRLGPGPAGSRRGPLRSIDADEVRRRWEAGESVPAIARAIAASDEGVRLVMDREGMERR
jgi:hypothetical protein